MTPPTLSPDFLFALAALFFLVGLLHASVGQGGASGYLAILSLFGLAPAIVSTSALLLNVLVAGTAFVTFYRAGHFSWRLTWPFVLTSVPAALVGGLIPVTAEVYRLLLGGVLAYAGLRLMLHSRHGQRVEHYQSPALRIALPTGAGIGLLSGIVGVGGGIFLSPLMILLRWADAKNTAATSAAFIVINSIAGLSGRLIAGRFVVGDLLPLMLAAFAGGLVGAYLGAHRFNSSLLRRVLGVVLLVAALRLIQA
jgi:Predicted permeases